MIRFTSHQGNASKNHNEASFDASQLERQAYRNKKIMVRIWGKRYPNLLLAGTQPRISIMEESLSIPQKSENRSNI